MDFTGSLKLDLTKLKKEQDKPKKNITQFITGIINPETFLTYKTEKILLVQRYILFLVVMSGVGYFLGNALELELYNFGYILACLVFSAGLLYFNTENLFSSLMVVGVISVCSGLLISFTVGILPQVSIARYFVISFFLSLISFGVLSYIAYAIPIEFIKKYKTVFFIQTVFALFYLSQLLLSLDISLNLIYSLGLLVSFISFVSSYQKIVFLEKLRSYDIAQFYFNSLLIFVFFLHLSFVNY